MYVTLLLDDRQGTGNPSPARWSDDLGLTYPVIADADYAISQHYAPSGTFGIPLYAVLDRQLRIRLWGSNTDVRSLVAQLLAEPRPTVDWPMP